MGIVEVDERMSLIGSSGHPRRRKPGGGGVGDGAVASDLVTDGTFGNDTIGN
ncbi:hypothetical protein [Humibacter sp. RRB41]|uniref:hypothetical protein n=1 Tax=Humibacter sp. RRB41 TaxID=2919946 RepID=UPI001FAB10F3|nr:hypothetical protein [Humibacter sp. RRB41]